MRRSPGLAFLLLFSASILGQAAPARHASSEGAPKAVSWADLPHESLAFPHPFIPEGLPHSPAITAPLRCSPNGTPFLEFPLPPTFMTRALVSVTKSGKVTTYASGNSVPGLQQVSQIAYFPQDKYVYYLVEGRENSFIPAGSDKSSRHYYSLRYSEDGTLDSTTPLDITTGPVRIGAFPSGALAIMGVDPIEHYPQLILLDSGGKNSRLVDIDSARRYESDQLRHFYPGASQSDPGGSGLSAVASAVQFLSYGDDLLLVQMGTNYPVLELGEGGILRSVPLRLPAGSIVESLIQSSERFWLARIADAAKSPAVHWLVAFDPGTGEPIRTYATPGVPPDSIACDADGTFLAFEQNFEGKDNEGKWALVASTPQ